MPAGLYRVWVAPPGWPQAPPGWRPFPGWAPDPTWPVPPANWSWWKEGVDRRRFMRSWRTLVVLIALWGIGNLLIAAGLWHQSDVARRFLFVLTMDSGQPTPFSNPVAAVMGGAALLVLFFGVVAAVWLTTFGLREQGWRRSLLATSLFGVGLTIDVWLFWVGPFADTGWWGQSLYADVDQMRLGAALAAGAAAISGVLFLTAVLRRRIALMK